MPVGWREERICFLLWLSPQPEAPHVNLETDQKAWASVDTLALCITQCKTPDGLSQERDLERCCEMRATQHCEAAKEGRV